MKLFHNRAHDITGRKLSEEALRESEEQFSSLTQAAPEAILLVDDNGCILSWNRGAQNIFGYCAEEAIGKPVSFLIPHQYRETHDRGFAQFNTTGESCIMGKIFEFWCLRKDGTQFPTEISLSTSEARQRTFYCAIIREITARKLMEQKLIETTEYLNNIIESSLDCIVVCDQKGFITRVNTYFIELLGYQEHEIIGKNASYFFPKEPGYYPSRTGETIKIDEEFLSNRKKMIHRLLEQGRIFDWKSYLMCKNGMLIPVAQNVVFLPGKQKEFIWSVAIIRDISEQNKTEKKLRESDETLRTLINMAPESLFLLDIEGNVIVANETLASRLGVKSDELIGRSIFDFCPPELREVRQQHVMEALRTGRQVHFEDARADRHLENFIQPVIDAEGAVKNLAVFSLDVTERKLAEMELRQHRDHLDELVKEKTAELTEANQKLHKEITERLLMEEFLRKSEEKCRMLVEHANSIILRMDTTGVVTFFNEFAQQFFGYSAEEILGRNVLGTIVPETDSSGCDLAEMIRDIGQRPERYALNQNENMRHNGERVWIAWTNKALCDDAGIVREILCIGNDITRLKQTEEKLLNYQKKLQSLASELSLAEERERRRIAVDLHDRIAQSLAFARIKIDCIKSSHGSDELGHMLDEVCELIGQTIHATRTLTIELCPPILYELGFEAALEWLTEQTQNQYGIKTSFANDYQQKPLDDDIRIVLFQATRELLVNVAKHAQARTARVSIERVDSSVHINVEDDGIGFDMAATEARMGGNGGFGLFSIRERLKYLGGSLECNSQAGQGTRISITAPVKNS
jgi:PAS domain S-box-containing protein